MGNAITSWIAVLSALVLTGLLAEPAAAQERPAPVVDFAAGTFLFPDDGVVSEGFWGASARFYVSPRVSLGPEVAFVYGDEHSHLTLTGNLRFDLVGAASEQRRVAPYLVVGGGLFRTRESFSFNDFSSNEGAFTAGGGVNVLAGDRVVLGVEARAGWEAHIRVNATVGVRLGR